MNKEELDDIIEYINNNRVDSRNKIGGDYRTLKAAKIASYFSPYLSWHDGSLYMKGRCMLMFST